MSDTIKQLVFTIERELSWREIKSPAISDRTSAIIRPIAVARSDLDASILCKKQGSPQTFQSLKQDALAGLAKRIHLDRYASASVVGQQCVAEVIETGPDVTGLPRGKRVVVTAKLSCGSCLRCQAGMTAFCETYSRDDVYGTLDKASPRGGLLSDLVLVVNAGKMLVPLPDSLDMLELASAGSDLGAAWCSVMPHLQGQKAMRVLILGGTARSTALYAVALATSMNMERVDYVDDSAERAGIAAQLGANVFVKNARRHQGKYDLIVCGNVESGVTRTMLALLDISGTYIQLMPMSLKAEKIPFNVLYRNNLTLALRQPHILANLRSMLEYLSSKQLDLSPINTHLADFDAGVEHYAKNTTKVVLHRPPLFT